MKTLRAVPRYGVKRATDGDCSIGQVAAMAGVSVETIRFYQRRGLLQEPAKPERGYRRYPRRAADDIRFIKRAQTLGFTLDEVAMLLRPAQADACETTRKLASAKLESIDAKVTELLAVRSALARLVELCDPIGGRNACAILEALSGQVSSCPCAPE